MKAFVSILFSILTFTFLTLLTQIGGIVYLLSELIYRQLNRKKATVRWLLFAVLYLIATLLIVPTIAPFFGRVPVKHRDNLKPSTCATVLLNRNYVTPELNNLLQQTAKELATQNLSVNYLDACFPFYDKFPLLPHLSHNDGRKIDLSFIYVTPDGQPTNQQKSISGYGVFEPPKAGETDQTSICKSNGHKQYDLAQYLTFGRINKEIQFSASSTKQLIQALLKQTKLEKIFIEPHLKERLNLQSNKVRFHGCHSVRHDDHIHIQL
ncbi:MAG: hypothetical protein AAGI23_01860 [Bacteroidota bacterium]